MARAREDQPLLPTLLDSLIDDQPGQSRDPVYARGQLLHELVASVARDLEALLNTRRRCTEWPDDLTELEKSVVGYGLPDLMGGDLASPAGRESFRRTIERTIRVFEPRFKSASVELIDSENEIDRTFRFRIDAVLFAQPGPAPVVFDSQLEPSNGDIHVKGKPL